MTAIIAQTSTHLPELNKYRRISNTFGIAEEAQLLETLGAVRQIYDPSVHIPTNKFRIILDSYLLPES